MSSSYILSDNGASSGSAGIKQFGGNDGALLLQTSNVSGTPTTAISISNTQVVTYTNQPTYTGGTANGVLYLNGSKAVTSGTALVFDGSQLDIPAGSASAPALSTPSDPNTGIFFPAADAVSISTGGTERLRVDASGNLGLGVTPSAWTVFSPVLQINTSSGAASLTGNANDNIRLFNNAYYDGAYKRIGAGYASYYEQDAGKHAWHIAGTSTAGSTITFTQAMTLDASGNLLVGTTSSGSARLYVRGSGTTSATASFEASNSSGATRLYVQDDGTTRFFGSSGSETARIDSSGNLLVGTTSVAQTLSTNNVLTLKAPGVGAVWGVGPTSSYGTFYISRGGTGVALSDGATSWGTVSDERTKDIIEPITNAAEKVAGLRAVIGKYKTDVSGVRRSFLIAQDIQAVLPEAIDVGEDADNTLSVKYTEVIPLLVAAIKEQQQIITQLQADVAALKGQA